jgi:uracil-DNA glycosylase
VTLDPVVDPVVEPALVAPSMRTWSALAMVASGCQACPDLVCSRSSVVVGTCPPGAGVLFVGEAPGAAEDAAGVPFVGKSGQLLDRLLAEVGLPRGRVAVANVLKCRPPGNRKPRAVEVERCRPWLTRQIELANPAVICTLGGTAAEWMFGRGVRIASLRSAPQTYAGRRVVATYHPSAAIRFGPAGVPLAALREDWGLVARVVT